MMDVFLCLFEDLELDSERASASLTHQTVRKNISLKLKTKTEGKSKKKEKKKSEKKTSAEGRKTIRFNLVKSKQCLSVFYYS